MVVFLLCFWGTTIEHHAVQCFLFIFSPPKMAYIIFLLLESSFEILPHRITYYQGSAQEILSYEFILWRNVIPRVEKYHLEFLQVGRAKELFCLD